MSLLLFMLYIDSLVQQLIKSEIGFDLSCLEEEIIKEWRLPTLLNAANIVLLAGSLVEHQALLNIHSAKGSALGMSFNAGKSATMWLGAEATAWNAPSLTLQSKQILWPSP